MDPIGSQYFPLSSYCLSIILYFIVFKDRTSHSIVHPECWLSSFQHQNMHTSLHPFLDPTRMYRRQHDSTRVRNAYVASYYSVTIHHVYFLAHYVECTSELLIVLLKIHHLTFPWSLMYARLSLDNTLLNIILFKLNQYLRPLHSKFLPSFIDLCPENGIQVFLCRFVPYLARRL